MERSLSNKNFKRIRKFHKIHWIMKERSHDEEFVIRSLQTDEQINLILVYMNLLKKKCSSVIPQNRN